MRLSHASGAALSATAMTVLGSSVAISRSIVAYPTLTGQTLRYTVAATILALLVRRGRPVHRMDLLRLAALSATGLVGFNVCLLAALGERPRVPTVAEAVGFGYLALVLTVGAFLLWYAGLHRLGVARAGMFVGVLPVSTLAAAALLDGRLPRLAQVVGVLIVAVGLAGAMITETSRSYDDAKSPRSSGASAARTASANASAARRSAPSASMP